MLLYPNDTNSSIPPSVSSVLVLQATKDLRMNRVLVRAELSARIEAENSRRAWALASYFGFPRAHRSAVGRCIGCIRADSYFLHTAHQNCALSMLERFIRTVKGPWDTTQILRLSYVSVLWCTVFKGSETLPVIRHDVEHDDGTIRCSDSPLHALMKNMCERMFHPHLYRPNRILLFERTFLASIYHQFSTSRKICAS